MERRILLDNLIDQTSACMRDKLKLSLRTVYGQSYGYMKVIQDYCLAHGEKYYNPILLNESQQELESRYERGEIKQGHYLGKRKCLERLTEYYNTGTLSWTMHKLNQKYRLFDEYKALLEEFLQTLVRDPNTSYDYSWVIRRYLNYLRSIGITDVRTIKTSDLVGFILSCSKEVTRGSLRNILSYTKRFHEFLRDTGRLNIPFEGLFAVSVTREEKIQQPLTTEELNRILAQIDLSIVKGKRNLAIILLGSELGLRASDIINLKLTDIDWVRKELHIQQQKTGYPVKLPLTEKAAAALRDYILNGRRQTDCESLFLKLRPPYEKIGDAVALDKNLVSGFLDDLERQGCSVSTRNHKLKSIRALFAYAAMMDISLARYYKELEKIPWKKETEPVGIEFLNEAEMKVLLAQPDTTTKKGIRDLLLMIMLYDTGARIQELLNLKICDIQFSKSTTVKVFGKGGKCVATNLAATKVASNAYGAPYAKNAHFCFGRFERFLLVGKSPKPFESQVPCELRTLRALEFCS